MTDAPDVRTAKAIIFDVCETSDQVHRVEAALGVIENARITGETSDGYHTFNELYDHRITLFIALCRVVRSRVPYESRTPVWRSKLHSDGTAIEGWYVLGIGTKPGWQITYHLPLARWDETNFVSELDRAPAFDGHTSADVIRRLRDLE